MWVFWEHTQLNDAKLLVLLDLGLGVVKKSMGINSNFPSEGGQKVKRVGRGG